MVPDTVPAPSPTDTPRRNQWQLPAFLLGLSAAIAAWNCFPPQSMNPDAAHSRSLNNLKRLLEKKPPELAPIEEAITKLTPVIEKYPGEIHRSRFLLGSAHMVCAEFGPSGHAQEHWTEATKLFSECDPGKLTDKGDTARCAFRSAKAAAATGVGDPKLLIPALSAIPAGEEVGEVRRLLAETCLRINPPDLKRARDEFASYLGANNRASAETIARHKLKLAELSLSLNEPEKAQVWLEQIGTTAPAEIQAVAKVQRARLAASRNRTAEAVKLFEDAGRTPGLPADQRGMVLYETGRGLQTLNDLPEAQKYYLQARAANGTAGVAASVKLASIAARSAEPGPNPLHPAELLESVVRDVKSAADFQNPLVGVEELRATFEEVIQAGMTRGDYESAVRAVAAYSVVAPPGRARQRQAEATAAWATKLASSKDPGAAEKFQSAAADFTAAAVEQTDPTAKSELFRRAADCFIRAGDKAAALDLFDRWSKTPGLTAAHTAPAALAKADLLLGEGKFTDAIALFREAAAVGGTQALLANYRIARAQLDESTKRLRSNPPAEARREAEAMGETARVALARIADQTGEEPGEREIRQQALADLGKHLVSRNLSEAEHRLRQLMQTNPSENLGDVGRLYLGTVLLMLARGDDSSGRAPDDADRKLTEAVTLFEELSKSKSAFYRSHGDIRLVNATMQLRKFDEMPALCETMATRYRDRPEELIVLSFLYTVQARSDRPALAERTLSRMTDAFARIPKSAYSGVMEEMTQNYWVTWFDKTKKK